MTLHATAVALGEAGVLLLGPPGSGKSDLALRLIDRGATLIADDRVVLTVEGEGLRLAPPARLAGRIEVRGVGILALPFTADIRAAMAFDLALAPERLPEPAVREIGGVLLPCLSLAPFEASAPLKVEQAVAHLAAQGMKGWHDGF
jgi:serine kinase of HPr protein (carbohydrate metabolism regulator)